MINCIFLSNEDFKVARTSVSEFNEKTLNTSIMNDKEFS